MFDIDKYTKEYSDNPFEKVKVYYRKKKIIEVMKKGSWGHVLEIGCGLDPLFNYVKYDSYCVIEPSPQFFEGAKNEAKKHTNIECVHDYFGANTKLPRETYDCIICSSLLHEVKYPAEIMQGIHRFCDENTIVHVNVPNAKSLHRLLGKSMEIIKDEHDLSEKGVLFQQNRVFDMDALKDLVTQCGFKIINEGSIFVKPFSHDQMKLMLDAGCIDRKVLDGLYHLSELIPEYGSEIYLNLKKK